MVVKHGSLKKVLYSDCQCLRGKYEGKYLGQLKKIIVFVELKQTRSWMS
jgi:hypothetical protein